MIKENIQQQPASSNSFLKQAVIGLGDGLMIVFALSTALSLKYAASANIVDFVVITIIIGALILAVGGYFSAKARMESLAARTETHEKQILEAEAKKTISLFQQLDLDGDMQSQVRHEIEKDSAEWKQFLEKNQQDLEQPKKQELPFIALSIGTGFVLGGMLAAIPYYIQPFSRDALLVALWLTPLLLFIAGFIKSKVNKEPAAWGAVRLMLMGIALTGVAWLIGRIFLQ